MINNDFPEKNHVDFKFTNTDLGLVEMDNKEKAEYTSMPNMNCGDWVFHLLLLSESYKTHLLRN